MLQRHELFLCQLERRTTKKKKKATCRAIKRTSFFFCLLKDEMKRTFNHTDEKKKTLALAEHLTETLHAVARLCDSVRDK